jgi:hypothetical protein
MAKEATVAEKHVAQAGKALRSAENDEEKAEKVCLPIQVGRCHFSPVYIDAVEQATRKAQQARDKTVKKERSTARALKAIPSTSMTSLSHTNTRQRMTFPCASS